MKGWEVSGDTLTALPNGFFAGISNPASDIAATRDGAYIAVVGNGFLKIYKNNNDGSFSQIFSNATVSDGSSKLAWSPSGGKLVVGHAPALRSFIRTGDTIMSAGVYSVPGNPGGIAAVKFSSEDRVAFVKNTGVQSLDVLVNDAYGVLTLSQNIDLSSQAPFVAYTGLAISSDGAYLFAEGSGNNKIAVLKRAAGLFSYQHLITPSFSAFAVNISADSNVLVVAQASSGAVSYYTLIGATWSLHSTASVAGAMYVSPAYKFSHDGLASYVVLYGSNSTNLVRCKRVGIGYVVDQMIPLGGQIAAGATCCPPGEAYNGFKAISGHVYDYNGAPVACTVRAYRRDNGNLVASTASDPTTGAYGLDSYKWAEHYVVALDAGSKNAMVYDHITPVDLL